jgi:beta-carotene 3-hydroxylase
MKRIVQAHRLHHATETKDGSVSFGFIWAPRPGTLKAKIAQAGKTGLRPPSARPRP